jgi:hypothetical protein
MQADVAMDALLAAKDWSQARDRLTAEIAAARGLVRIERLAQRCHAERGLARLDLARLSLGQAVAYAEAEAIAIPEPSRLQLAEQLERNGQLDEAAAMLGPLAAQPEVADLYRRLREAIANRDRLQHLRTRIMAVGQNCLPDHLAMRWGFAPLMVGGPFSAAMFFGNGAARAIADDFQAFSQTDAYRRARSVKGFEMAVLPRYRAELNHQLGGHWLDAEFTRIKALYGTRIDNWRRAVTRSPVLFVATRIAPASIGRLWRALAAQAPDVPKRLVILDFLAQPETPPKHPAIRHIPVDYPDAHYRWYTPKYYSSSAGANFERPLAQALLQEVLALEADCSSALT